METKIGKVLVGLSKESLQELKQSVESGSVSSQLICVIEANLNDEEYELMLDAIEKRPILLKETVLKFDLMVNPKKDEQLKSVVCPELCCEGCPTYYGADKTHNIKNVTKDKFTKVIVRDESGKILAQV